MEEPTIVPEISDLLQNAMKDSVDNYSITHHEGNKKGEGFLGEFIILSLQNKKTNQETHLAIKQSTFDTKIINEAFKTEIYFYKEVWPKLQSCLQSFAPGLKGMNFIAKCLATDTRTSKKRIVLENLKFRNFEIYDKTKCFDKYHMELIFKTYGKLHALSFAFKEKDPENFKTLTKPFVDQARVFDKIMFLCGPIKRYLKRAIKGYNGENKTEIVNKTLEYVENTTKMLKESFIYTENYSVVTHGDCWSNNLMFKYDVSIIILTSS